MRPKKTRGRNNRASGALQLPNPQNVRDGTCDQVKLQELLRTRSQNMPTAKLLPPRSSAMALLTHARLPCAHRHRLRLSDACPGLTRHHLTQFHSEPRPDER